MSATISRETSFKLLNNHNHRKKWSFSERLVTLLYWLMSFFVLQFESIKEFDPKILHHRSIVIGTRVLVNAHLQLRATKIIELHLVSDVHRLSSIPYCPWIEKGVPDALRSFFSARNRIEDRDTQEITSTSEHVLRSFAILLRG